jgi:hypothetical protein
MSNTKQAGESETLENLKNSLKKEEEKLNMFYKEMSNARYDADSEIAKTKSNNTIIIYNIFSSLLLIISYILFGIASTLFINTCINFKKASIEDINDSKLIDQPIFEYLKPINNLSIDKFLIYFDGTNSPFVWVIISIFIVSSVIVALIILYWMARDKINLKNLYEDLVGNWDKRFSFIIKLLPYIIIILIIYPIFNSNQKNFDLRLGNAPAVGSYNLDFEKNIGINNGKYYKNLFKNLKNIIIHWINNNNYKNTSTIDLDTKITALLTEKNKQLYSGLKDKLKINIFEEILAIYYNDYNGETMNKVDKIKFITSVDEYFNILINIKSTDTNYYARYYLLGLIENDNKVGAKNTADIIYKLRNFKMILKKELIAIKNDIKSYYITVLVFYGLFLIIILCLYFPFIFNTITELLFMYKITYIGILTSVTIIIVVNYFMFNPDNPNI